MGRKKEYFDIDRPHKEKTLPSVVSKEEIQKIIRNCTNFKHRCIISLIYSAGLRPSEPINLEITDILSDRNQIRFRGAKGKKDNMLYTGYTADLKQRMQIHETGKVPSTQNRKPLELIYFEGCKNQQDATRREKI